MTGDIRTALASVLATADGPEISTVVAGLGGRAVTRKSLQRMLRSAASGHSSR